jgi:hypothetical protein
MSDAERITLLRLAQKIVKTMRPLDREDRIVLLGSLLAQEICTLPAHERFARMRRVQDELPDILRSSEEGMRLALTENARSGGS